MGDIDSNLSFSKNNVSIWYILLMLSLVRQRCSIVRQSSSIPQVSQGGTYSISTFVPFRSLHAIIYLLSILFNAAGSLNSC